MAKGLSRFCSNEGPSKIRFSIGHYGCKILIIIASNIKTFICMYTLPHIYVQSIQYCSNHIPKGQKDIPISIKRQHEKNDLEYF